MLVDDTSRKGYSILVTLAAIGIALAADPAAATVDPITGLMIQDSSAVGWLMYEMDVNPNDPGAIDLDSNGSSDFIGANPPTVFNTDVADATDGNTAIYDMTRPGVNNVSSGQGGNSSWDTQVIAGFDAASGFTLEARMKVVSVESDGAARGIHIGASPGNGQDAWLNVLSDSVVWGGNTDLVTLSNAQSNTDGFHVFRVAYQSVDEEHRFWVWRDNVLLNPEGSPLPDGHTSGGIARNFFGSPGNDWGGVVETDYLRFVDTAFAPVPEPASFAALGLAVMVTSLRRHSRQSFRPKG